MIWYNPTKRTLECIPAPLDDAQATKTLSGHPGSARFIEVYREWRKSYGLEEALQRTGDAFRTVH